MKSARRLSRLFDYPGARIVAAISGLLVFWISGAVALTFYLVQVYRDVHVTPLFHTIGQWNSYREQTERVMADVEDTFERYFHHLFQKDARSLLQDDFFKKFFRGKHLAFLDSEMNIIYSEDSYLIENYARRAELYDQTMTGSVFKDLFFHEDDLVFVRARKLSSEGQALILVFWERLPLVDVAKILGSSLFDYAIVDRQGQLVKTTLQEKEIHPGPGTLDVLNTSFLLGVDRNRVLNYMVGESQYDALAFPLEKNSPHALEILLSRTPIQSYQSRVTAWLSIGFLLSILLLLFLGSFVLTPYRYLLLVLRRMFALTDCYRFEDASPNPYEGEVGEALELLAVFSRQTSDLFSRVNHSLDRIVNSVTSINGLTIDMSKGAEDQSLQTTYVASAIEEMSSTISEVAKNATQASEVAKESKDVAATGGNVVSMTIHSIGNITNTVSHIANMIEKLGNRSVEIGDIIIVIDDVAEQINLLALNAAIEAARAGELGQGFAVVADEVRKLAERTVDATNEITKKIKNIQEETQEAVNFMKLSTTEVEKGNELAERAGDSLTEIVEKSQVTAEMITNIAVASEELSQTSIDVAKNIDTISGITQTVNQGISEISSAADELERNVYSLKNELAQFK